jgi:hypothetical protein
VQGPDEAPLHFERGIEPGPAIAAVRTARPGAIQTSAQERHVEACRELDL